MGFATSVSAEPMLDMEHAVELYEKLDPFVSDAIWIGKMNRIDQRVSGVPQNEVERVISGQTDEKVKTVYEALKDRLKIKWKESVKEVVGLPLAQEVGLDV